MARRAHHEEHENHERWLVSYADFITLLFAFFVVMYSLSAINEGKFKVLSDSLVAAFRGQPRSLQPIQEGTPVRSPYHSDAISLPLNQPGAPAPAPEDVAALQRIADEIESAMRPLIDADVLKVTRKDTRIEITVNSTILFPSGSARLEAHAAPVLTEIAATLKPLSAHIHVQGHTDDQPIHSDIYPSNWELSAARAASVVHLFTQAGLDPAAMAATGLGEFHPVGENATVAGRRANRRVIMVVEAAPRSVDPKENAPATTPSALPSPNAWAPALPGIAPQLGLPTGG